MRKILALLLAAVLLLSLAACGGTSFPAGEDAPVADLPLVDTAEDAAAEASPEDAPQLDENGVYDSRDDVALYLHLYGALPHNYITKRQARELGWSGGSVEAYAPGCCIGGDRFGNYEGLLPEAAGRTYYECDIDTLGAASRGAKRIIYSSDGLIYYTEDHYASFTLLYGEVSP